MRQFVVFLPQFDELLLFYCYYYSCCCWVGQYETKVAICIIHIHSNCLSFQSILLLPLTVAGTARYIKSHHFCVCEHFLFTFRWWSTLLLSYIPLKLILMHKTVLVYQRIRNNIWLDSKNNLNNNQTAQTHILLALQMMLTSEMSLYLLRVCPPVRDMEKEQFWPLLTLRQLHCVKSVFCVIDPRNSSAK